MILTLTVNPSIDQLARLDTELRRGRVFHLPMAEDMTGGKGINVPKALHCTREKTLALYPTSNSGKFTCLLEVSGIPREAISTTNKARVNFAFAKPGGTTTKLDSPGMTLAKAHRRYVLEELIRHAKRTTWVVFAGPLPSDVPQDSYVQYTEAVYSVNPNIRVALDTSDGPLTKVVRAFPKMRPFLMKPNVCKLGQIIDQNGEVLEAAAAERSYLPVVQVARVLNELGVSKVLVTLGEAGAVLSVKSGDCFAATSPSMVAQSTISAGDCVLVGYIISCERGDSYQDVLTMAVAYGVVATSFPDTAIPYPEQVHPEADRLWQLGAQLLDT